MRTFAPDRIKTGRNHGSHVYFDKSLKYVRRNKNGTVRRYYHHSWRAVYWHVGPDGMFRIRKRFSTRSEALQWLGKY